MTMRLAIAVVAAALTAGCAVATTTAVGHSGPTASPSTANNADRKASADADARGLLAAFVAPAGAHQISVPPAGAGALARNPAFGGYTTSDVTSWWEVTSSRTPAAIVAEVAVPTGAKPGGSWGTGGATIDVWSMSFYWPAVGRTLVGRQLIVSGARVGAKTVLRVDGETTWVPQRPKDSLIPFGVASIAVTFTLPGPDPGGRKPYDPITITHPGQIETVIALVDAAPVDPYPPHPCPQSDGELSLSFRSSTGIEVANAQATINGCDDIYLQIGTSHTTATGGRDFTNAVIAALNLPWQPIR